MNSSAPFTRTQAIAEAFRCLQCFDAPCMAACPASIHIPRFIRMIRSGNLSGAAEELRSANAFITLCGAVCPSSVLCRSKCTRNRLDTSIAIGELHRFITASVPAKVFPNWPEVRESRVAVVGAGPAGLGCALTLAQQGIDVTVFEKEPEIGGIPVLEIPEIRAGDEIEKDLRAFAARLKIITSRWIHSLKDLREFDAVFIAVGLGKSARIEIEGEELDGVEAASSFLRRARKSKLNLKGNKVTVVGGGNTAMDAAVVALEAGAEVTIVYRRRQVDLPAWEEEVAEVAARGAAVRFLENPVRIIGEAGHAVAVDLQRQQPGEPDASGRPRPIPTDSPAIRLPATRVIIAVGTGVDADIFPELTRDKAGRLAHDADAQSGVPGVFVGGDAARGEGTIVAAFAEGRRIAGNIAEFLRRRT